MEACSICGKEFKNLSMHVRMAHENEYQKADQKEDQLKPLSEQDKLDKVFGESLEKYDDMTLAEYLEKNGISLRELNSLVSNYKGENPLPQDIVMGRTIDLAYTKAQELAGAEHLETDNVYVAEALEKNFGYTTVDVVSPKPEAGIHTKMYKLQKNK